MNIGYWVVNYFFFNVCEFINLLIFLYKIIFKISSSPSIVKKRAEYFKNLGLGNNKGTQ